MRGGFWIQKAALVTGFGWLGFALLGCEGTPPSDRPQPAATRPTSEPPRREEPKNQTVEMKPADAPTPAPNPPANPGPAPTANPPSNSAAAQPPPTAPIATPPAATLPEYLKVLERFETGKPFKISARTEATNRLALDTDNVKRLQITRKLVPLQHERSIAIFIDEQGIEWTPKSEVVILERSINGVWKPAKQ